MNIRINKRSSKFIAILSGISIILLVCTYGRFVFKSYSDAIIEQYKFTKPRCISKNISTIALKVSTTVPSWDNLHNASWSKDLDYGYWSPEHCYNKETVAIIIPYRDRESHLKILLNHLHPFLQRQKINYQIFLFEQSANGTFNKGALANAGYDFVNNITERKFSCFIFHDVDMLPIKDQNIYQCLDNPLHLGAAVDKFKFKPVYETIVGGVLAMTPKQFTNVNGYSNIFVGWGGEDDDMFERIKEEDYKIFRYSLNISQYIMIKHERDKGNPLNEKRVQLLLGTKSRYKFDGLNSIEYNVLGINPMKSNLIYWVTIELPKKFHDQSQIP